MRIGRRRPDVGFGSPLRRLVALALASLLLAGTLDAGLVHPCPHHDVLPGPGTQRGARHGAPGDARADRSPHDPRGRGVADDGRGDRAPDDARDGHRHATRGVRSHDAPESHPRDTRGGGSHTAREGHPHAAGHAAETHASPCTCIGDCLAGGGLSLAPAAIVRPGETPVVETTARRLDSGRGAPVRRTAYLLPYSTAPPPQR